VDFFERQDKARRHTAFLVFYFIVAVVLMIGAVYLAVALIFGGFQLKNAADETTASWSQASMFLGSSLAADARWPSYSTAAW
jgi:hypothetical protein